MSISQSSGVSPQPEQKSGAHLSAAASWLLLRCLFVPLAIIGSLAAPQPPGQEQVKLWPPAAPFSNWLARVTLEPWNQCDTKWYVKIAQEGYRADDGTAQFHPLFPLLGRWAGKLCSGNMLLGLLLVSSVCSFLLVFVLQQLAALDLPKADAQRAAIYFLHLPAAFILFAPYTEALFLLCCVMSLLLARRGRWQQAGIAGALAALTRQQGIFLLIPLAWELWEAIGRDWRKLAVNWRNALALVLVPGGLLVWLGYRALALNDLVVDWRQPQTLIYGLLISRSATQVVAVQSFAPPWQAFWHALRNLNPTTIIDLSAGGTYLLLLALGWRRLWRMRPSYLLYAITILLVSFSYSTGEPHPYLGLPRHCLLAFPLVFPLAEWGQRRSINLIVMLTGLAWLALLALCFFFYTDVIWLP